MIPRIAPRNPLLHAIAAQVLATITIAAALLVFPALRRHLFAAAVLQGACAALFAKLLRSPAWWLPIHLCFLPGILLAGDLRWPPWLWLGGFIGLLLIFWRTDHSRVPLYLSNDPTCAAVAALLPARPCMLIDIGCGTGRLLRHLAAARPDCRFVGIEHAPLTWLWAWLGARRYANVRIVWGDYWTHSLAAYDIAYSFLSPAPMAQLGEKVRAEMSPAALLVSNSFPLPDAKPLSIVTVADRRNTRLYCYRPQPIQATKAM